MKVGDMVRFAKWGEFNFHEMWSKAEKPHIGILVEHDKTMKSVVVLYKGELLTIRSELAEKAGKKDYLCNKTNL